MSTIRLDIVLRENCFVGDQRKTFLRLSREAAAEVQHRLAEVWLPELARIAAEKAHGRGSKTVGLVDVLDSMSAMRRA